MQGDGATAVEYVLGNLPAEERLAFERRLDNEPALRELVGKSERHFDNLANRLALVRPSDDVWHDVERAIPKIVGSGREARRSMWANVTLWRLAAAASLTAAIVLAYFVASGPISGGVQQGTREFVWVLSDGQKRPTFVVRYDEERKLMTVIPLDVPAEAGKDMQLWLIPSAGSAGPRSLGLLQPTGLTTLPIGDGTFGASAEPGVLAVSVEPSGGSTAGAPTGPVILQGKPTLVPAGP